MEFVRDSFLFQHVREPTHFRGDQTPPLIDLVFSSEENMITNLHLEPPIGKSHHLCIYFDFHCDSEKRKKNKSFHNYRKADFFEMRKFVTDEALAERLTNKPIEQAWNCFAQCILSAITKCVPITTIKETSKEQRKKPEWWSEAAKNKLHAKRSAYKLWLCTKDDVSWKKYKIARNEAKKECKKAEQEHEKKIAYEAKRNPKVFYSFVNKKLKVREGINDLMDKDGTIISSDVGKANVLNEFFCSVFTNEENTNVPTCPQRIHEVFEDIQFSKEKVFEKLSNINTSKSGGPDGINARVLKELAEVICEPVSILFNQSMKEGKLPSDWKDANVTPLFKKGDKSSPNNYRPVSLTCLLCKIMESIVRDDLIEYLNKNELLSPNQHGFISRRSCTTNLLATIDEWTECLDNGSSVDAIYLDFSKAFDSVPHLRLLEKLKAYGITSHLLKWIKDFLIGRRQRVNVNGSLSSWTPVTSGVPQGSVLGPVLFVIFVNDLPEEVKSSCQMYADDTKLFASSDDIEMRSQIQTDLDNLVAWANRWQLRFNAEKCHVLHLGRGNNRHEYEMKRHSSEDSVALTASEAEKDLGILVDRELTFAKHIEIQVGKANRILGLIKRSFSLLDENMLKQLFTALVRPLLEYANLVWSPRLKQHMDMIERVQRRATKMLHSIKDLSYEKRLETLKLPSLKYRRKRGDLIEAYKYVHGFYDVNKNLLQMSQITHTRGHQYKLTKQRSKLELRKKFFSLRVVNDWNMLPASVVEAPTMNSFKARLDSYLGREAYQYQV